MTAHGQALFGTLDVSSVRTPVIDVAIRPAAMADIDAIVELHREAFADKFGGAFGRGRVAQGTAALASTWRRQGPVALRGMFVAERNGLIVGTATLRTWEYASDSSSATERVFQEELGTWGAARSLFALSLLDHEIAKREGFITDVAVHAEYRRGGVARSLLARIEDEALRRGKHFLGLYVSAANVGAHALYQRIGFCNQRTRRSLLARIFFGQGRWFYMRKDLV